MAFAVKSSQCRNESAQLLYDPTVSGVGVYCDPAADPDELIGIAQEAEDNVPKGEADTLGDSPERLRKVWRRIERKARREGLLLGKV